MSNDGAAFNRLKAARQQEQCLMSKLNRIALDYRRAADAINNTRGRMPYVGSSLVRTCTRKTLSYS